MTFRYPRLLLAMEYDQKAFVAHPNVQQVPDGNNQKLIKFFVVYILIILNYFTYVKGH